MYPLIFNSNSSSKYIPTFTIIHIHFLLFSQSIPWTRIIITSNNWYPNNGHNALCSSQIIYIQYSFLFPSDCIHLPPCGVYPIQSVLIDNVSIVEYWSLIIIYSIISAFSNYNAFDHTTHWKQVSLLVRVCFSFIWTYKLNKTERNLKSGLVNINETCCNNSRKTCN